MEADPSILMNASYLFMDDINPDVRDSLQLQAKRDRAREIFGSEKLIEAEVIEESKEGWIASPPQLMRPMHLPDSLTGASSILSNTLDESSLLRPMNPLTGIVSVADVLASKALPWQALHCPRALEFVNKLRNTISTERHHTPLLKKLSSQIHENVASFILKKEIEVEAWTKDEAKLWSTNLNQEQDDLEAFFHNEQAIKQERRSRRKENLLVREQEFVQMICDIERNDAKEIVETYKRRFQNHPELVSDQSIAPSLSKQELIEKHSKLRASMR
jgi:hypothetical protein